MPIRLRKLVGAVALIVLVVSWSLVAMALAQLPAIKANGVIEVLYYVIAGLGWVPVAMPLVRWMTESRAPGRTTERAAHSSTVSCAVGRRRRWETHDFKQPCSLPRRRGARVLHLPCCHPNARGGGAPTGALLLIAPLGAPPWRFSAPGPRFRLRHCLRSSCSELLAARVVVPGGRFPYLPGPRLQIAAAGRQISLRLRIVSSSPPASADPRE